MGRKMNAPMGSDAVRGEWAMAARSHWARAYAALDARKWAEMRAHAQSAKDAEQRAGMGGQVLTAIFGGMDARPSADLVALGSGLPSVLVAQARQAVVTEMAAAQKASAARSRVAHNTKHAPRLAKMAADSRFLSKCEGRRLKLGEEYSTTLASTYDRDDWTGEDGGLLCVVNMVPVLVRTKGRGRSCVLVEHWPEGRAVHGVTVFGAVDVG